MTRKNDNEITTTYQIRVQGYLDSRWSDWFNGFEIMNCSENTILTGSVPDQAALHGVLSKIGELGLVIISIKNLYYEGGNDEES